MSGYSFGIAILINNHILQYTYIGINKDDFITYTDIWYKCGALGNQLFKYAIIRKCSTKYGSEKKVVAT